jgi:L-aspartate oxidase
MLDHIRPGLIQHDGILVVGAGLAGLTAALAAAPRKVLLLTEAKLNQGCSSAWAQGGMAAALSDGDTPEQHAADTVSAGAGLVDPAIARLLADEGPSAVHALADLGAPFDRTESGGFAQSLEAAHGRPRVARVRGDQAGAAIMRAVTARVLASGHIEVRTGARLTGLLQDAVGRVRGVTVDWEGCRVEITAAAVILATGGIGGLYAVTTTPAELKGEGLGLAALAGAVIADPEFVQFHPTAIDVGRDPAPLATEALRGEGAVLVNTGGARFMARYHPDAELAPRDVVARAIHAEREAGRGAFLDARAAVGDAFPDEFPAVFAACMAGGVDPRVQPIPVAPACHYHMGGIATDAEGRSSLKGLYAAGECASTGLHGANRLASNSLVEAAVFGARAGRAAAAETDPATAPILCVAPPALPLAAVARLRAAMSRDAGVVRDAQGLTRLLSEIDGLQAQYGLTAALAVARLVAACGLSRTENRGAHFRTDGQADAQTTTAPRRTFLRLTDLAPQLQRHAAE